MTFATYSNSCQKYSAARRAVLCLLFLSLGACMALNAAPITILANNKTDQACQNPPIHDPNSFVFGTGSGTSDTVEGFSWQMPLESIIRRPGPPAGYSSVSISALLKVSSPTIIRAFLTIGPIAGPNNLNPAVPVGYLGNGPTASIVATGTAMRIKPNADKSYQWVTIIPGGAFTVHSLANNTIKNYFVVVTADKPVSWAATSGNDISDSAHGVTVGFGSAGAPADDPDLNTPQGKQFTVLPSNPALAWMQQGNGQNSNNTNSSLCVSVIGTWHNGDPLGHHVTWKPIYIPPHAPILTLPSSGPVEFQLQQAVSTVEVPLQLQAEAASGARITYRVVSGPARMSATSHGVLLVSGPGTIVVAAREAGSSTATEVQQNIVVHPAVEK